MTDTARYITLSQLQQRIKAAVEQSLPLPQWVVAEISELKVNYSGHCYLELVEKSEPTRGGAPIPRAQVRAVIWRQQYAMLSSYFHAETGSKLASGMKIMAKVIVSYHELYGLSLQITDLDPSYTLGEVERQRQMTIAQLQADGVWDLNREEPMPLLVQRVAVVSSGAAAGYRDFCNELSAGGYAFRVELFDAVMQGQAAEESLCQALERVAQRVAQFDAVVIIRGGGSASDLSCFNSYRLCSYVAQFPLPVITGIGHDKDVSVADMVAHTPLKTPTAVAAWLTERMARQDGWLEEAAVRLMQLAQSATERERVRLERHSAELHSLAERYCERGRMRMEMMREQLRGGVERLIERQRSFLRMAAEVAEARAPERILNLGFAVVRCDGRAITSAEGLSGREVEIELAKGSVKAEIK
ncbi:MAG: exodeoxyribonuclease VII large subunit [Alistipes sp.]|nr:exodeoxyribonuclease VII large subunit [Alistipes sp.]MBQ5719346.1 exodeoxyribonuclease VII large subunit [Alistipes sp.]